MNKEGEKKKTPALRWEGRANPYRQTRKAGNEVIRKKEGPKEEKKSAIRESQ